MAKKGTLKSPTSASKKPPRTPSSNRKTRAAAAAASNKNAATNSDDEHSKKSGSVASCSTAGTRTTATRERLPRWLEKLLAQVFEGLICMGIENIGVGKKHKLEHVLDDFQAARTEEPLKPLGERGDEIRRKIAQKHQGWKKLPREKHLVKLAKLKVPPAEASSWKSHRSGSKASDNSLSASLSSGSQDASREDNFMTPKSTTQNRSAKRSTNTKKKKASVPKIVATTSPEVQDAPTPRAQPNLSMSSGSDKDTVHALAKSLGAFAIVFVVFF